MDGEKLVTLLIEYDIGVQRASYNVIEPGEEKRNQSLRRQPNVHS